MYSDTLDDILKLIPVRRNYLKHVIDEWFEETYLDRINKDMGQNDITVDLFDEVRNGPDVCVPPMTKPDDVTLKQMIDYLHTRTLFSMNELKQKSPEWIENLYLQKLRENEENRLRRQ